MSRRVQTYSNTYRGRVRHEHKLVPVPREIRVELWRVFGTRERVAKGVGTGYSTADALMSPFGVVRAEVIERAKACLARRATGS